MKKSLGKIVVVSLVLITSVFISSAKIEAAIPQPNFVMSLGSFNYVHDDLLGYGVLSITMGSINSILHADGSIGSDVCYWWMPECSVDALFGGSVTLDTFNNSGGNWTFAPTDPTGDEFTVKDSGGATRLTADIWQFTVDKTPSGDTFIYEVNAGFNEGNVGPISTALGDASEFIDDVNSFSPPWGELYLKFNFTESGTNDFTTSQSGTISGTFAVVPEPISSILFLSGGATLAFRRYVRKKNRQV